MCHNTATSQPEQRTSMAREREREREREGSHHHSDHRRLMHLLCANRLTRSSSPSLSLARVFTFSGIMAECVIRLIRTAPDARHSLDRVSISSTSSTPFDSSHFRSPETRTDGSALNCEHQHRTRSIADSLVAIITALLRFFSLSHFISIRKFPQKVQKS
jgi:hypothetical protein